MSMKVTLYFVMIVVSLFFLLTILVARRIAREMQGGTGQAKLSLAERMRRYVGPVEPEMAILRPWKCVALEFFTAICGFPGIGWLMSTRVAAGLILSVTVPAFVWAIYPTYLCVTGKIAISPFLVVNYLPFVAVASSGALAGHLIISARKAGHGDE